MGELRGIQFQPREIAEACYEAGWKDAVNLCTAVQVCLAESQGFSEAVNWNYLKKDGEFVLDGEGKKVVASEDHGPWQINTQAHPQVTIEMAQDLEKATKIAYQIYARRQSTFNAWYAFQSGVYLRDTYLRKAARGVGNFLGEHQLQKQKAFSAKLSGLEGYETGLTVPILDYRAGSYKKKG
jgi:hypothetical protein